LQKFDLTQYSKGLLRTSLSADTIRRSSTCSPESLRRICMGCTHI